MPIDLSTPQKIGPSVYFYVELGQVSLPEHVWHLLRVVLYQSTREHATEMTTNWLKSSLQVPRPAQGYSLVVPLQLPNSGKSQLLSFELLAAPCRKHEVNSLYHVIT